VRRDARAREHDRQRCTAPGPVNTPHAGTVGIDGEVKGQEGETADNKAEVVSSEEEASSEVEARRHVGVIRADLAYLATRPDELAIRTPLLVGHDDTTAVEGAIENMKETLAGYDSIEHDDESWHERVTPPGRVQFQQINLALPEDQGDTPANVFVDDEVTDASCILSLIERAGRWQLAFKMFKVL
jgi:hypothetical protein